MKQRILSMILMTAVLLSALCHGQPVSGSSNVQKEYYVSSEGNDSNPGTAEAPFKSLEKARDEVRTVNGNMTGDIIVYIKGGTYELKDTLAFGPQDSGTNGFTILYKNYPGEKPVLSGGKTITGWTLQDPAKNIWEADAAGIETRQLYVDGVRKTRARSEGLLPVSQKTVDSPWSSHPELLAAPNVEWLDSTGPDYSLLYENVPYNGSMARVFAYFSLPANYTGGKIPAMVLLHGGGGAAYQSWARQWAGYGYAAIAIDMAGQGPDGTLMPDGRPADYTNFDISQAGLEDSWYYHAVAATMRAISFLSSRDEVDTSKIGVYGISMGGIISSIAMGVDSSRIKLGVPVYASGYMHENSIFARIGNIFSDTYKNKIDPKNYLGNINFPTFWVGNNSDDYIPMELFQDSRLLTKGDSRARIEDNFAHAHEIAWDCEDIRKFVDSYFMGSSPYPEITSSGVSNGKLWAYMTGAGQLDSAELVYTVDPLWMNKGMSSNGNDVWVTSTATEVDTVAGYASAMIPANCVACYLNLKDSQGRLLSTNYYTVQCDLPGAQKTDTGYTTTYPGMESWGNVSDIEFVYNIMWTQSRVGVASISGKNITMKQPAFEMNQNKAGGGAIAPTVPTYIENAYELLDKPGEWYLDRSAGTIYYMPEAQQDMGTATVIAPVLETLIKGTGEIGNPVHNIQFEGLTFSYATWLRPNGEDGFAEIQANFCRHPAATIEMNWSMDTWVQTPGNIEFSYAKDVRFERNTFQHLGAGALHFGIGSQNNSVSGNTVCDISSTGIQIGGGSAEDHHPGNAESIVKNNKVTNNYIYNIGAEYKGGVGIWVGYAEGTKVAHNELTRLPYTGISVGWGWGAFDSDANPTTSKDNKVTDNYIHDIMNTLMDGGGIYVLGAQPGLIISGNVVSDQHNDYGALYLDDGARYVTVQDNVVFNNVRNMIAKGLNHVISNNFWDKDFDNMYWQQNSVLENNTVVDDRNFPLAIINKAGIEYDYQDLLPREEHKNLALNKPVKVLDQTAESNKATQPGHPSGSTVDNDLTTYTTVSDDDSWVLQLDLGRIESVGSLVVSVAEDVPAAVYSVKTTVDGTQWEPVGTIEGLGKGKNIFYLGDKQVRNIRVELPQGKLPVNEIEVYSSGTDIPLALGETARLWVGDNQGVIFASEDEEKGSVSASGEIEALSAGNVNITATNHGLDHIFSFNVARLARKSLEADQKDIIVGKSAQLLLVGFTAEGMKIPINMGTVTYSVDDNTKAAINADTGLVTGIQDGVVEITATHTLYGVTEEIKKKMDIVVERLDTVKLLSDKEVYHVSDGTAQLTLQAVLNSGEVFVPGELGYTSDNAKVAAVNGTGLVTITGEGIANISVDVTYGGVTKTARVKLKIFPEGWKYVNIHSSGNASYSDDKWQIGNTGDDIWGTSDTFTYVYKDIAMKDYPEGVSIVTTIDSISEDASPSTMTGLMIRDSIDPGSKNVNYRIHSTGVGVADKFVPLTWRLENGGATNYQATPSLKLPATIKLTRAGNDIYAHYLNAQNAWVQAGIVKNAGIADNFTIGIAHCSHSAKEDSETVVESTRIETADIELEPDPIHVSVPSTILKVGDTMLLDVKGKAEGETLQFISDDVNTAAVDANGTVTGVASGRASITVKVLKDDVEQNNRRAVVHIAVYQDLSELDTVNAALNKQAFVLSQDMQTALTTHESRPAEAGVDGNVETAAQCNAAFAYTLKVDLGDVFTVKSMEVLFLGITYATDYQVLGSLDGSKWDVVGEMTGNVDGAGKTFTFDSPVPMKYAAVKAIKPDGPNQTGLQMAIAEFRVNAYSIKQFIVDFDTNGGSPVESQTVDYSARVGQPTEPVKEGFTFLGWYADSNFTNVFHFESTKITGNTTVYAKWIKNPG